MAQAPAIEKVISALVTRLEAIVPTKQPRFRFHRSDESLRSAQFAVKSCTRLFNVDATGGQDDSQEGRAGAVQNQALADRVARFSIVIAYPRAEQEKELEDVMASDGEWAMRKLARSADWTGTPVRRATCRWSIDRTRDDKLFLVLVLEVQYRDTE